MLYGQNTKDCWQEAKAADKDSLTFSLAVIIPAYNEEYSIGEVVTQVHQAVPGVEVVVIDDGSSDRTTEVAKAAGAQVLRHPYNKGNGAAIKTALKSTQVDKVVIIDADGQHPAEMIPALVDKLGAFDLVVGTRTTDSQSLRYRYFGNWLLRKFASYLSDFNVPDLTSGFRALDRRKALDFIHLYPNGFSFPTTSTLAFISAGYNILFVPVLANRRLEGTQSKIRPIRDGLRFVTLILRMSTMINPLRVFLPTGLTALLIGIAWTTRNVLAYAQFSVAGTLLIMVGLNVLFFGIVVDQLAALRLQRKE